MEKRGRREKRRREKREGERKKRKRKKRISKKTCLPSFLTENVKAVNGMNLKGQFSNYRYATCG